MNPLRSVALLALLILVPGPGAAAVAASAPEPQALHGPAITPREFEFNALPRLTGPYTGPIMVRPEAYVPGIEERLEQLKEHPEPPTPSELNLTIATSNPFAPLAPVAGNGFEGITQGGFIPSEPTVGAGPLNIFSAGNISVTVTNKDGSNRVETNGATFFGVTPGEGAISDAQCYYDALRGRFVALCFTHGTSPSNFSNFYLAISKTNDARGAWWLYQFDMSKDGATQTTNWSDYQAIGISEDKLAFSGQQFSFAGNSYQYQKIRIIDRALAYSGATVSYVDFANFAPPAGGDTNDNFVTKVGRNLTVGDATIHCLCVRSNGGSRITYRSVTGSPSSPTLSAGNMVTVTPYSAPVNAVQMGNAALVPTNDCRPPDFYIRNGVMIAAWHTSISLGGTVTAIRMLRLRTNDRAVLTDETYAASGTFLYFPAVTVDSVGTIFLGFGRSSSTEFPSAWATGKRRSDGSLQSSVLLKSGLTATTQTRWGDYTGIDNDAALSGPGGAVAWYAGQWTKGTNAFGTWINKLTFTYGQIAGTVYDDCDANAATTGDRFALAGVGLTLLQGVTTVATTTTDANGNYNFGYLDSGTYDAVVTPPPSGSGVDAIPGSGGNAQTRIGTTDLQVTLTDSQTSTANQFLVTSNHATPVASSIVPNIKNAGAPSFTLTVNGSNFVRCAEVRLDGSLRATTWISANQLTANIPDTDIAVDGAHLITVFNPAPGGGTSNSRVLTVGPPDVTPPIVTLNAPTGGESWPVGSNQSITWTATDDLIVDHVDLAYSTDGSTFPNSIATGLANTGSYAWTVPGTPSATARVRVIAFDGSDNVASDSSHVVFAISGWTITSSAGANGTVSPNGVVGVPDGATPTYTITPGTGYHVVDVLVNGGSVGAVTSYTFDPIHANQTLSATFAINTYTLTVNVVGSGSVAKNPDQASYDHGTMVNLTATPSVDWTFSGWSGDATGVVNPLAVTMLANQNITATFQQGVYVWNQTGTAAWGTASNWTPSRDTPATTDVLVFNNGATTTATGVPTQTIGQLVVLNGTSVALQPSAAATLTIAGTPGTDLDVAAGATLRLNGTSALTVALGASATGSIGGTVAVTVAAHRLTSGASNALEFLSGSSITLGTGFTGSVFGFTSFGSVVFRNGSLCAQSAGSNPFGAAPPNAVVTFQTGSRFRLDGAVTPSFSGRTYADFECNSASTVTATGASATTIDSLLISLGTVSLNVNGGANIRGNVRVKAGAALNFSPSAATATTFNGPGPQIIEVLGTFSTSAVDSVVIANPAGVTMFSNLAIAGQLRFAGGKITTGSNTFIINSTGSVLNASQGSGWVVGNLRRNFASGNSTRVFDVGDAASHAPVTVAVTGAAGAFDLAGRSSVPDHPSLASSSLDPARSVNRSWTLTPSGSPSLTGYDATFAFPSGDMDAGADPTGFLVGQFGGSWSIATAGARTASNTEATGLTTFGDFAVAEPVGYTLATTIVGAGTIARAPTGTRFLPGTIVNLVPTPGSGFTFTGWSGSASGNANPLVVTMDADKAITATFTDVAPPTVAVTAPNGGESFLVGANAMLTWTATDNAAVTLVDLTLSRNGLGGPFDPIATGIGNSGSYLWAVTGPASTDAYLGVTAHDAAGGATTDESDAAFAIAPVTAVESPLVTRYELAPVSPNPMYGRGSFGFALPQAGHVRLDLIDLQGREMMVIADREYATGRHQVAFSVGQKPFASGLYFVRLQVAGKSFVKRFVMSR